MKYFDTEQVIAMGVRIKGSKEQMNADNIYKVVKNFQ